MTDDRPPERQGDGPAGGTTDRPADGSVDRTTPGIAGIGAYTPRLRVTAETFREAWGRFEASGIERKAVPEADEDALTMGAEAARRALAAAGRDGRAVRYLAFATTTPPVEEEDLTPRLASVLGAPGDVTTQTHTASTRAGGQALAAALAAGPREGVGLVVASDCPRGAPDSEHDHAAGAGAAALVLGEGPGSVRDSATAVEPYPGTRFRPAGERETTGLGVAPYDRSAFTSVLGEAAAALSGQGVDAAAVQSPDGDLPSRAADALGVSEAAVAAAETVSTVGDAGAASAFLGLAAAVADGAERVVVATFGSGAGATVFLVDCAGVPVEAALAGDRELSYAEYLRRRGVVTGGEPAGGGAYVSVPSWRRTLPQRHRLVAGRCPACGALNLPPSGACRACADRSGEYESVTLPGTGTVKAATTIAQGGAPPEFVEQQARSGPFVSAIVAFDGPDGDETVSLPVQMLAAGEVDDGSAAAGGSASGDDVDGDDADGHDARGLVGTPVEATVRRIYEQEGVVRYGVKVQPVGARR